MHTIKALAEEAPFRAAHCNALLSNAVRADLEWSQQFWEEKRSPVTAVAKAANHTYLKSQGQAGGSRSYGRMVELLIAEWRASQLPGESP